MIQILQTLFLTVLAAVASVGLYTETHQTQEAVLGASDTRYERNIYPREDSTYELGTSSYAWLNGTFDELCLTGDSCVTTFPGTAYTAGGTLLDLTGTTFSINEGTLTDTKYCTYEAGTGIVCNSEGGSGGGSGTTTLLVGDGNLYTATSTDGILAAYFNATSTTGTSTFSGDVAMADDKKLYFDAGKTNALWWDTATGQINLGVESGYSYLGFKDEAAISANGTNYLPAIYFENDGRLWVTNTSYGANPIFDVEFADGLRLDSGGGGDVTIDTDSVSSDQTASFPNKSGIFAFTSDLADFLSNGWTGSTTLTTLGTIVTGVWNGAAIDDAYIASSSEYLADNDTTYTATGTLLALNGTEFGLNEGTLTDTKFCTYESGTGIVCNSDAGGSQTPWTQNIDAAGYNLSGFGTATGTSIDVDGGNIGTLNNTVIGEGSGATITSGDRNVMIGYNADVDSGTIVDAISIGNDADSGTNGVAIGKGADVGGNGVAIGTTARDLAGLGVALGYQSLVNTSGSIFYGVAIGGETYSYDGGVAIGYQAGKNTGAGGQYNTLVGYQAGNDIQQGDRNIIIGYTADTDGVNDSDRLNIGNTLYGDLASDYIGIGTSTPWVALVVGGDMFVEGNATTTGTLALTSYDCSGNTNGGKLTVGSDGQVVCDDDESGGSGTSYFSYTDDYVYPATSTTPIYADHFVATSTTATSTFAGPTDIAQWISQQGNLGLDLTDDGSDLTLHADVGGTNAVYLSTDGAFMGLTANPGPSNDYIMWQVEETQGDATDINIYEGGTGHNRLWSSGSVRIGGSINYLCSELTSVVDCDTPGTGADLVVQDDIWSGGTVYAENIQATTSSFTTSTVTNITASGNVTFWSEVWTSLSDFSTYVKSLFSSGSTELTYNDGEFSVTTGYTIPETASTTEWAGFYNTPSTRITAGTNLSWSGNTLNATGGSGTSYFSYTDDYVYPATSTTPVYADHFVATSTTATSTFNKTEVATLNSVIYVPRTFTPANCAASSTASTYDTCVEALVAARVAEGASSVSIVNTYDVSASDWTDTLDFDQTGVAYSFTCETGVSLYYGGDDSTTTEAAIRVNNWDSYGHVRQEISGCTLYGQSSPVAAGGSITSRHVGLYMGGATGAVGYNVNNMTINGFGTQLEIGANAYLNDFNSNAFSGGYGVAGTATGLQGSLVHINTASNSGERNVFSNNSFTDPANSIADNCFYIEQAGTASNFIENNSFDDCQIRILGSNGQIAINSNHFENAAFSVYSEYIPIYGDSASSNQITMVGNLFADSATNATDNFDTLVKHGNRLYAAGNHLENYGGQTVTYFFDHSLNNGSSAETICSTSVQGGGLTYVSRNFAYAADTSAPCHYNYANSWPYTLYSTSGNSIRLRVGNAVDALTMNESGDVTTARDVTVGRNMSVTGTATSSGLAVTSYFDFLGDYITNVGTWFDTKIEALTNVVLQGVWNFGGATSIEIVNGTGPTVDTAGEIALDTTDNQLLVADSSGTSRVFATAEQRLFSVTVASTSVAFIEGGNLPIAKNLKDGRDITQYRCYVEGGTSYSMRVTDGTNSTETITCATTVTSDTDVATNSTFTAGEKWYLDFVTETGSVDYVVFEAYGYITVE